MQTPDLETAIRLDKVSRYFGDTPALKNLDLEIPHHQVIGLLGLNGAGKSTCLQILAGTLAPSLGKVMVNGKDLHSSALASKAKIGYLPEQPPLYAWQTVDEYLEFIAQLYGLDQKQRQERVVVCKQLCDLGDVGSRTIGNLSKGYQQRVGIAQAILHEPDIIILDEPTVGLDPQQLIKMRELVRSLSTQATVIISSHMLSEVHAVADRIVILHQGELVHDGPNTEKQDLEDLFSQIIFDKGNVSE